LHTFIGRLQECPTRRACSPSATSTLFFGLMLDNVSGLACALFSLCGVIHSPLSSGALFSPLSPPAPITWHLGAGYAVMALACALLERERTSHPLPADEVVSQ